MGIFRGLLKAGIAAKAFEIVRREASKPQNQAKAKQAFGRFTNRRSR